MSASLSARDALRLRDCVAAGGVAVFPADTVYGVCCDPDSERAVERLYELKGRSAAKPAAMMFFTLAPALAALGGDLADAEREAMRTLLPGPVTLVLPNRARRFAPACAGDPDALGVRVPLLSARLRALQEMRAPVMQSSANLSGRSEARTLDEVPPSIREDADLVLDGGELPGTPSTVIDLRHFDAQRDWRVLREGALTEREVAAALAPLLAS